MNKENTLESIKVVVHHLNKALIALSQILDELAVEKNEDIDNVD